MRPLSALHSPEHGLSLDLFVPEGKVRAVVLYLHGGGFLKGSRTEPIAGMLAVRLAPSGVAVASADYRLRVALSDFGAGEAAQIEAMEKRSAGVGLTVAPRLCGPAMIAAMHDAGLAVAALKGGAALPVLRGLPVVICGVSAGGIAGLSLAYPPKGFAVARPDGVLAIAAAMVQPWRLVAEGPPCVMLHGVRDRVIGLENARLAARRADARGAPLRLVETGIAGHNTQVTAFIEGCDAEGRAYFDLLAGLVDRAIDAKMRFEAS